VPIKCVIHPPGDEPHGDGKEEAGNESIRAGCLQTFPRSALISHQKNECPKGWMLCTLSMHGCKARFQREQVPHLYATHTHIPLY
jgi:hypothetical protein